MCVILNRTQGLSFQTGLPPVQHEDRIGSRRVERSRYAASHCHMRSARIGGELDVRRERDVHENGCVGSDPGGAVPNAVVAPVGEEKGIVRMGLVQLLCILRGDGTSRLAVTGTTSPAVTPERLRLEKAFALTNGISLP